MRWLLIGALVPALAGCASYGGRGLEPDRSVESDVRAVMGAPFADHPAEPGQPYTHSLEYPRGPAGRHTYMARIDAAGKLVRIDQVIDEQFLRQIKPGVSTRDDVRRVLGRPGFVAAPHRLRGESWDYYGLDFQTRIILYVSFDANGVVASASKGVDPAEIGRGRRR